MPRFSICISTYNDDAYISACIESVLSQSYGDFELVIVDDGSTDSTAQIIADYSSRDNRVVPIICETNSGVHLGRMLAVERSTGDYLLFLDSDDRLLPGCLQSLDQYIACNDFDYLHFGAKIVGSVDVDPAMVEGAQNQANCTISATDAHEVMRDCYYADGGYKLDWRVWQRLYKSELAKKAFASMKRVRMGRGQDAYEHFVLASLVRLPRFDNDIIGYEYHYGRGVTSGGCMTEAEWRSNTDAYCQVVQFCHEYAVGDTILEHAADGLGWKLLEGIVNDWRYRLAPSSSADLLRYPASLFGWVETAAQLMRVVRDDAYSLWDGDGVLSGDENFLSWYNVAKELAGNKAPFSDAYSLFSSAAKLHIDELRRRTMLRSYNNQGARIFVSTHKRVDLFDSKILQPVQVGCSIRDFCYDWALHDDEGENISNLNPMYCELTTQYWAWKNVDAPYIGFCHYRRYFDFSSELHEQNSYGEVMDSRIDAASQKKYCLDDASITKALEGVDVVTTVVQDIRSYLGPRATLRSQYDAADHLYVEDLDRVVEILIRRHPEYAEDAREFLGGHTGCFCNMFIMKRDIFRSYCAWLFPLLEEFVNTTDMSKYSREGVRTPGHLSERLLNIYLNHQLRQHPEWNVKRLQCVHFTQPDYNPGMKMPVRLDDPRHIIPVVFASDNNYVPMLTTTIYSMLRNASSEYRYDITVLHRDISGDNQCIMRDFLSSFDNVEISFCDVSQIIDKYNLTTNNPHISVETYYRFLIQDLLPHYDKVLYLDSDLIVKGDVSELFAVDLGDALLAAAHDIDFVANVNMKRGDRLAYARDILGMKDPYGYFQAGVLVLNTRAMRAEYTMEQWLEFASDERFIYNDQDVLNAHCEGKVVYLDYDWNVMIDCCGRIGNVFSFAPAGMLDAFMDSRNHEKIVHYAGVQKPWKQGGCDRDELYWGYARDTPFYERLLMMPMAPVIENHLPSYLVHDPAISPDNKLRKIIDPIAPLGSARRELAKSVVRTIRGIR